MLQWKATQPKVCRQHKLGLMHLKIYKENSKLGGLENHEGVDLGRVEERYEHMESKYIV